MFLIFALCVLELSIHCFAGCPWGYNSGVLPSEWVNEYEDCKKQRQSPIDINSAGAKPDCKSLKPFGAFENTENLIVVLSNTGHTVQINFFGTMSNGKKMSVPGGGLGTYYIEQAHFHFGEPNNQTGSEHTVDGRQYPMEVHFVGYTASADSVMDAAKKKNGLAVLGVFFEIGDTNNTAFAPITDKLHDVKDKNDKVFIESFNVNTLLANQKEYYRYLGSLTTPGCFESVIWTVFKEPIVISQAQMDEFYALSQDSSGKDTDLVNTYRPVQPLNNRRVRSSCTK